MPPAVNLKDAAAAGLAVDVPPMVLQVQLAAGPVDLVAPGGATVAMVANPILAAALEAAGATRTGSASWVVALSGDDPSPAAIGALIDVTHPGCVYGPTGAKTSKGPKDLWAQKNRLRAGEEVTAQLAGTAASRVAAPYWQMEDPVRNARYSRLYVYHPSLAASPAGLSLAVLKVERGRGYISLHTHFPKGVSAEYASKLDLRPVGRQARHPKPLRAVDLYGLLSAATGWKMPILDPDGVWEQLQDAAESGVMAWPCPGQPARANLLVSSEAVQALGPQTRERVLLSADDGRGVVSGTATAADLAAVMADLPQAQHTVASSVADILDMSNSEPWPADHLYSYQQEAVGAHLATGVGLVVALDPGMGKTVTTLETWRVKARSHHRFRGLVITEAALRQQWSGEIARWFPEASVAVLSSAKDVDDVAAALAQDGPVVIVAAYSAMKFVSDTDMRRDWEAKYPLLAEAYRKAGDVEASAGAGVQLELVAEADAEAPVEGDEDEVVEPPSASHPVGELLLDTVWDDLAADEAEALRGTPTGSKAARGAWALRSKSKVAVVLTGTPINRNIDDLGRLVAFARGDASIFDGGRGGVRLSTLFDMATEEGLAGLRDALGPTVFRRATSEATGQMPQVTPHVVMLDPSGAELALDQAARGELKRVYEELVALMDEAAELNPESAEYAEAAQQLREARGAWLGGTTLARQAASDPAALLGAHSTAADLLAAQGVIAAATARPGTKRTAAIADVTDRVANGEKVLVFTEFSTVARGLIADLDAAGVRVGQVLGGGGKRRDADVAAFQAGDLDALVLTSSGEKGLNLQAATTLVHYDLPWTPKGVLQRTGRARRLASDNDAINVVFYVLRGTIDERVATLVVTRAVEAMRALDTSRGLSLEQTDLGSAFSGLTEAAAATREGRQQSVLLEVTRQLVADS